MLQKIFAMTQNATTERVRRMKFGWTRCGTFAAGAFLALGITVSQASADVLRLGVKPITSQRLLATMTQQYLAPHGYNVQPSWGLSTAIARPALFNGELDMMWEYTGTSLINFHHVYEPLDEMGTFDRVSELDSKLGLTWLSPACNDSYAIAMPETTAQEEGDIRTISQMAERIRQTPDRTHLIAMDIDFGSRPDGMPGLMKHYDVTIPRKDLRSMDAGAVYLALQGGQAYAGEVYNTDGRIQAFGLRVLKDDQRFFPAYNVAPMVRTAYVDQHPDLAARMKAMTDLLDETVMRELNARIDVKGEAVSQVAHDFLIQHHLL